MYTYIQSWKHISIVGFVGLKNGGATCYMNSVLQQMFMIPGVADALLSVDEPEETQETKSYVTHLRRSAFFEFWFDLKILSCMGHKSFLN